MTTKYGIASLEFGKSERLQDIRSRLIDMFPGFLVTEGNVRNTLQGTWTTQTRNDGTEYVEYEPLVITGIIPGSPFTYDIVVEGIQPQSNDEDDIYGRRWGKPGFMDVTVHVHAECGQGIYWNRADSIAEAFGVPEDDVSRVYSRSTYTNDEVIGGCPILNLDLGKVYEMSLAVRRHAREYRSDKRTTSAATFAQVGALISVSTWAQAVRSMGRSSVVGDEQDTPISVVEQAVSVMYAPHLRLVSWDRWWISSAKTVTDLLRTHASQMTILVGDGSEELTEFYWRSHLLDMLIRDPSHRWLTKHTVWIWKATKSAVEFRNGSWRIKDQFLGRVFITSLRKDLNVASNEHGGFISPRRAENQVQAVLRAAFKSPG